MLSYKAEWPGFTRFSVSGILHPEIVSLSFWFCWKFWFSLQGSEGLASEVVYYISDTLQNKKLISISTAYQLHNALQVSLPWGICFRSKYLVAGCSVFIFHLCESSEAGEINLMDKSISENRNICSNPQNLVFVQFRWNVSKLLKGEAFSFWFCILTVKESMRCDMWFPFQQKSSYWTKSISFSLHILSSMFAITWLFYDFMLFNFKIMVTITTKINFINF